MHTILYLSLGFCEHARGRILEHGSDRLFTERFCDEFIGQSRIPGRIGGRNRLWGFFGYDRDYYQSE